MTSHNSTGSVIRGIVWLVVVAVIAGLTGAIGSRLATSRHRADAFHKTDSTETFAERGIAAADQGDFEMANFLLRRAIKGMGTNPDECELVWRAIELLPTKARTGTALDGIVNEYAAELEATLESCESVEQFSRLYVLRATLNKASATKVPPSTTVPRPNVEAASGDAIGAVNEVDAASLFDEGLDAWRKNELDRADYLTQGAMHLQAQQPLATRAVWESLRRFLEERKPEPFEEINRLTAFQESVAQTLLACGNVAQFNQVFSVHNDVIGAINSARGRLLADIQTQVDNCANRLDEQKIVAALEESGKLYLELEPKLYVAVATRPSDSDPAAAQSEQSFLKRLSDKLVKSVKAEIGKLKEEVDQREQELAKDETFAATDDTGKVGPWEAILQRIGTLASALRQSQADRWLAMVDYQARQQALDKFDEQLGDLSVRATKLQELSYNIWALRQIVAADDVDDWDVYLSRIDTGLLHSTVSALYSTTYDSRVRQIEDPPIRATMVRNILAGEKVALTAF